jgi:hypothetical protein
MNFSHDVRQKFPERQGRFDELETFVQQYDDRFKRRCIPAATKPQRLIGHRAANLLLTSLSRARLLTATAIHCINGGLAPGMYLAARAHWEMTGLVAHLLTALRRFYGGEIPEVELEKTLKRLFMGRRWEVAEILNEDILAINALTIVGSAATLLRHDVAEQHVRTCYDFLSEHCHPNLLGRLAGVTLSKNLQTDFDPNFTLSKDDINVFFSHGLASHGIFIYAYDECFRLLYEHEEMPTIE